MFGDAQTVCPLTVEMNKRCILYKKICTLIFIFERAFTVKLNKCLCAFLSYLRKYPVF